MLKRLIPNFFNSSESKQNNSQINETDCTMSIPLLTINTNYGTISSSPSINSKPRNTSTKEIKLGTLFPFNYSFDLENPSKDLEEKIPTPSI